MRLILILLCLSVTFLSVLLGEVNDSNYFYEKAKQNCQDISSIRREMDRINNEILVLIAERTAYVKRAGDLKSKTTKIADDRSRVADQERKIIEKSLELGLPADISLPTFKVLMETSIQFQQQYIDQLLSESCFSLVK